jgi:hydrogenase/urease accessory protein HupE
VIRFYAFLAAFAVAVPLTLFIGWVVSLPMEGEAILASCLGLGLMDVFETQFRKSIVGDQAD